MAEKLFTVTGEYSLAEIQELLALAKTSVTQLDRMEEQLDEKGLFSSNRAVMKKLYDSAIMHATPEMIEYIDGIVDSMKASYAINPESSDHMTHSILKFAEGASEHKENMDNLTKDI